MPVSGGNWPKTRRRVIYDFMSGDEAPANDGIQRPTFVPPDWIDQVSTMPGALEIARQARQSAEGTAKTAEEKAARLVQVLLALLTLALGLGSYQLAFALDRSTIWLLSIVPIAFALALLSIATFESLQIDRVGFYSQSEPEILKDVPEEGANAAVLLAEVRGRDLARWTSEHKHSDLMQARAWFTRGLALLLIAGLVAGIGRAATESTPASTVTCHTGFPRDWIRHCPWGTPARYSFPGANQGADRV